MLYKQAWQELKDYLKESRWLSPDEMMRVNILAKMRSLEDKWKIILSKKGG